MKFELQGVKELEGSVLRQANASRVSRNLEMLAHSTKNALLFCPAVTRFRCDVLGPR